MCVCVHGYLSMRLSVSVYLIYVQCVFAGERGLPLSKVHHEALLVLDAHARTHAHTQIHTHTNTQPVTIASTMGFSSASSMTSVCAFSSAFLAVAAMLPSPDAVFSALRLMYVRGVSKKKNSLGACFRRQPGCIHTYLQPECRHI
jgi:hypothetical protein